MRPRRSVVLLDACVLAPMPVADTLLRLAEEPAFYTPRWSPHILAELDRTLVGKLGRSEAQARRRIQVMLEAFPEAMVEGYEGLTNTSDDERQQVPARPGGGDSMRRPRKRNE